MPTTLLTDRPERFDHAADLRRTVPADLARTVAERAQWCLPDERALIDAMYRQGLTAAQIAQLRNEPAPLIRRKIRVVVTRVLSPRFVFVLRHRDQWPPTRRRIATACVLQGRTLRQTAAHLQLSLHAVRRQMDAITGMFEAQHTNRA